MKSYVEQVSYDSWCCVFFFSSRRRHTRFDCDWSSDVCSSDLAIGRRLLGRGDSRDHGGSVAAAARRVVTADRGHIHHRLLRDRKSTRLNSSHSQISYAVFCLKKKK